MKFKLILFTICTMMVTSTSVYASEVSESGDAQRASQSIPKTAKLYDYSEKNNNKYQNNDEDKMLFNSDTKNNKYSDHNRWDANVKASDSKYYKIIEGLVESSLTDGNIVPTKDVYSNGELVKLFTGESIDYDIEFTENDGVYTFDNDKFLPLGNGNFYFGMKYEFSFTLSDDRDGMKFEFAGDDDVWVFIDNTLVLDLGGIHSKVYGTIDFQNGLVSRTGQFVIADGKYTNVETRNTELSIENGTHTLRLFYLERGGNNSRCKISFKLNDVKEIPEEVIDDTNNEEPEEEIPTEEPTVDPVVNDDTEEDTDDNNTIEPTNNDIVNTYDDIVTDNTPSVIPTEDTDNDDDTKDEQVVDDGESDDNDENTNVYPENNVEIQQPEDKVQPGSKLSNKNTKTIKLTTTANDNNDDVTYGVPKTGDSSYITLAIVLLAISGLSLLVIIKIKRQSK